MKHITFVFLICIISFLQAQNTTAKSKTSVQQKSNSTTIKTNNNQIKIEPGAANPNAKKYTFSGSYTMKFTAKNTQGKIVTAEIKSAFEGYKMATIPAFSDQKETNLRTIFDSKANTMTMLIDDLKKKKKSGMIMKMPKISITGNVKESTVTSTIKKTTETKTIDGYKCVKWIISYSNGDKCEAWITNEVSINTAEAIAYCSTGMKGKKSSVNTECANIQGCALESTYTAKDGSTVFMKLTDIIKGKPDALFFSTSGYELADVTGIEFFK